MAEADALRPHDPVDYRAAGLAGAETVPQVFLRLTSATGRIVVERAQPEQVRAVPVEFDAPRFDSRCNRDLRLSRSISSSGMRAIRFSLLFRVFRENLSSASCDLLNY